MAITEQAQCSNDATTNALLTFSARCVYIIHSDVCFPRRESEGRKMSGGGRIDMG